MTDISKFDLLKKRFGAIGQSRQDVSYSIGDLDQLIEKLLGIIAKRKFDFYTKFYGTVLNGDYNIIEQLYKIYNTNITNIETKRQLSKEIVNGLRSVINSDTSISDEKKEEIANKINAELNANPVIEDKGVELIYDAESIKNQKAIQAYAIVGEALKDALKATKEAIEAVEATERELPDENAKKVNDAYSRVQEALAKAQEADIDVIEQGGGGSAEDEKAKQKAKKEQAKNNLKTIEALVEFAELCKLYAKKDKSLRDSFLKNANVLKFIKQIKRGRITDKEFTTEKIKKIKKEVEKTTSAPDTVLQGDGSSVDEASSPDDPSTVAPSTVAPSPVASSSVASSTVTPSPGAPSSDAPSPDSSSPVNQRKEEEEKKKEEEAQATPAENGEVQAKEDVQGGGLLQSGGAESFYTQMMDIIKARGDKMTIAEKENLLFKLDNNSVYSLKNAEINPTDRLIFIATTFILRSITLFLIDWGIQSSVVTSFQNAFVFYVILYIVIFLLLVALVNSSGQKFFRLLLWYVSIDNGLARIILHVFLQLILLPIPFLVKDPSGVNNDIKGGNLSFEDRRKLISSLNSFTFFVWFFSIFIALAY